MSSRIERVQAHAVSFAVPAAHQVRLGIGRTVKRDAVIVRVDTSDGVTGWGEAHAARAPTAIAELADANAAYALADYLAVADGLVACRVGWLEEPFPAHDFASYRAAQRRDLVTPPAGAGLGIEIDTAMLAGIGVIPGGGYV